MCAHRQDPPEGAHRHPWPRGRMRPSPFNFGGAERASALGVEPKSYSLLQVSREPVIETRSGTTKGHSRFSLRLLRGVFHVYAQVRGWRDTRRLRRRFPALCDPRRLAAASARLEPTYRKYVTTVSSPHMAISLDLAAFLSVMCE